MPACEWRAASTSRTRGRSAGPLWRPCATCAHDRRPPLQPPLAQCRVGPLPWRHRYKMATGIFLLISKSYGKFLNVDLKMLKSIKKWSFQSYFLIGHVLPYDCLFKTFLFICWISVCIAYANFKKSIQITEILLIRMILSHDCRPHAFTNVGIAYWQHWYNVWVTYL